MSDMICRSEEALIFNPLPFLPGRISFNKYNMYSMRQPNAIESFEVRNQYNLASYLFTADEGATSSYRFGSKSFTDAVPFSRLQNRKYILVVTSLLN